MRRTVTLILLALLLLLQYPLWLGKGGWLKVWDLNRQVESQQQINQQTQTRNAVLDAEVRDLKQGTAAIEERARSELGMIKRDEVFYQVLENPSAQTTEKQAASSPASAVSDAGK
ncbi:MAG: cell division protein FtsB [Betaproteobacteria bacterium RBG_16_56_24]|nr:MAG: cell division protein FtsB [Betaproteobacteria bacterium RBG_16_56_24]